MIRSKVVTLLVTLALIAAIGGEVVAAPYDGCGDECAASLTIGSSGEAGNSCHNCLCVGTAQLSSAPSVAAHGVSTAASVPFLAAPDAPAGDIFLPPRSRA